jgi:hypothetical protein
VNIALIALSNSGKHLTPPLTMAYLATLLEQRRHIVRIYDLALDPQQPLATALRPLHSFRPHVIIFSGDREERLVAAVQALKLGAHTHVLTTPMSRTGLDAPHVCASVLNWLNRQEHPEGSPAPAGAAIDTAAGLDALPFPARHLLSLEHYTLRAVGGELQTTVPIGALGPDHQVILRSPLQIVAELRSVSREFGLRHYLFPDLPITYDATWLFELLTRLCDAALGIGWEAIADAEQLEESVIDHLARAGCEALCFDLDAALVFESAATRARLRTVVGQARARGIFLRANVKIEPPYESVPRLVDVAATFGLDDVSFDVLHAEAVGVNAESSQIQAIVRQLYDAGRDRQRFISRFGPALGNLIWRLRSPQRQAPNSLDDDGLAV